MVCDTTDFNQVSLLRPNNSTDVLIQSLTNLGDDRGMAVFRGVNDVVCQLRKTADNGSPAVAASRLVSLGMLLSAG